jgi:hypothetical protein
MLLREGDRPSGIRVIDSSRPGKLVLNGFLPAEGTIVLSPDGLHALVHRRVDKQEFNKATRHEITLIDLSDPGAPKERWRREILARNITLAPDAGAYVASRPAPAGVARWQVVVSKTSGDKQNRVFDEPEYSDGKVQVSDRASVLVFSGWGNQLWILDLRTKVPVMLEQGYTFAHRHSCVAAILETGHILVQDARAPRMGVYASTRDVARVSTLNRKGGALCGRVDANATDGHPIITDWQGRVERFNLRRPNKPGIDTIWQLPAQTYALAAAFPQLFAVGGKEGRELQIFRLDTPASTAVDWAALADVHRSIMDRYSQAVADKRPISQFKAMQELEDAGIATTLDAPVVGVSTKTAAMILNDYGFMAAQGGRASAEPALRRAVSLDPQRSLAKLNLADLLRFGLSSLSNFQAKQKQALEAKALYREYLKLGGRRADRIDAFLEEPVGAGKGDTCLTIASYANAGRLRELVSDSGTNIRVGDRRLDLVFSTQGTAHVPVVYAFDSLTDAPLADDELFVSGADTLWGGDQLGLLVSRDATQILHYRDFRHPVRTTPISGGNPCRFVAQTVEVLGPKAIENELCHSLSLGDAGSTIKFETPAPIAAEDVTERHRQTSAGNMRALDFANDGEALNVVELALSSTAGAGCDANFYDALNDQGTELASGPRRELLIRLQEGGGSCGNVARFFEADGKVYFENKPAAWPPADERNQYHRVTRIEKGTVIDVCDFKFKTTIVVER